MLADERERRQKRLEDCICELSERMLPEEEIRNVSLRLLDIYKGDFRHSYSGFFTLIINISKNPKGNLDFLGNNFEGIRAYIEADFVKGEKEFSEIANQVNKLCDHLNVEIGRWNYYSQNEQKIEDMNSRTVELSNDMKAATQKLQKASKQASSIQTELIAVLSIFAAIVVTFSGGFTFLGSAVSSINDAKYYEAAVLAIIVCGMAIFNTIFLLMYLVAKITERNIYAKCVSVDCTCTKKCGGIKRLRKRLPYVYYFNSVCIAGIIIDLVVWYCNIKGYLGI